jgi:signal-transduction protein with cAMP-binding, CBS, and nucleotidyltransferase domain
VQPPINTNTGLLLEFLLGTSRCCFSNIHLVNARPGVQVWRFQALQRVPILFNLSDSQLLDLAAALEPITVAPNEVVIREGEAGDCFYIIEDGTFSCYRDDGTKLALVDKGSCFGELALLRNEKRACNVAAEKSGGAQFPLPLMMKFAARMKQSSL